MESPTHSRDGLTPGRDPAAPSGTALPSVTAEEEREGSFFAESRNLCIVLAGGLLKIVGFYMAINLAQVSPTCDNHQPNRRLGFLFSSGIGKHDSLLPPLARFAVFCLVPLGPESGSPTGGFSLAALARLRSGPRGRSKNHI